MINNPRIAIIGLGYVGLPLARLFVESQACANGAETNGFGGFADAEQRLNFLFIELFLPMIFQQILHRRKNPVGDTPVIGNNFRFARQLTGEIERFARSGD